MSSQDANTGQSTGLVDRAMGFYRDNEQLVKYALIGGTASAIDVILFFILFNFVFPDTVSFLGMEMSKELASHSIAVPTSVVFSFVVNARHNFKTEDYGLLRFISFCIVCTIGYAAGYGVIVAVQQFFADPDLGGNIGKLASLPVVFIIQYVLNSKITFRPVPSAAT
ncbi:MAG: GtrA family protein [Pseudomonadota bacterium]